ncbi:TolC family protein [Prolixibacteraceae bacterium JC049]|nr:TolC family protein [Prolixibacteraceae bacterium JC049]
MRLKNNRPMRQKVRKSLLLTGGIALSFLTHSCFVAKKYTPPQSQKEQVELRTTVAADTVTAVPTTWKQFFQDELLIEHIETALTNNVDYRIASQQILKAQARLKQAKVSRFPSANVTGQWTESIKGNGNDLFNLGANISWEADIWGKLKSGQKAASATYFMSKENQLAVKTMLISQVGSMYLQLLSLDEQLSITKATLELREKQINTMKALKKAGMANEMELQQSLAQLHQVESLEKNLQNQLFLQENAMCILMGIAPQKIMRSKLDQFKLSTGYGEQVPAKLLANRPDLKAAELNVRQAFEQTNVARAGFYPSLKLSANGGYNGLKLSKWITPDAFFFNTVASIAQPLINGRNVRTAYEIAQLNQQDAVIQFENKLLNAGKEVSDALHNIQINSEQVVIKQQQLVAENKAFDISKELLNQGLINYLQVLVAQEKALSTQLDMVNLTSSKWKNFINLYRSLGGGIN